MKQSFTQIILFIFIFNITSQAQILNIEKARMKSDSTKHFFANTAFTLTINNRTASENAPVNFFSFNGHADLAYVTPQSSYLLINYISYLDINDNPFISTGYSHFRTTLLKDNKISPEVFAQGQYDIQRGLDFRFLSGAGLRLELVSNDKADVHIGLGGMYEHEEWQNLDDENIKKTVDLFKSSNYISLKLKLKSYLNFNIISYYQVGYDNNINLMRHRINSDANLNFKLSDRLAFRVNFSMAYENEPILPITKFIYSLSNGIQLNF